MAIDQALLEHAARAGTAVLRIYRWSTDSVSFGANEAATRTWDRERLERLGVPCVRRPTGGRAVWHDAADLTYAVTAPLAHFGGLRPAYRAIHEALAEALATVGIASRLAAAPVAHPGLRPGACFEMAVGGEVLVNGRKAIGSAQFRADPAFLQHGEIARADRLPALARFRLDAVPESLIPPTPDLPAAEVLAEAIRARFLAAGGRAAPDELTAWAELTSVQQSARFRDPAWTWRR